MTRPRDIQQQIIDALIDRLREIPNLIGAAYDEDYANPSVRAPYVYVYDLDASYGTEDTNTWDTTLTLGVVLLFSFDPRATSLRREGNFWRVKLLEAFFLPEGLAELNFWTVPVESWVTPAGDGTKTQGYVVQRWTVHFMTSWFAHETQIGVEMQ